MAKQRITTEQDWLTSADIDAMLRRARFRSQPRKSRLFGVACCRCAWSSFVDERSRQAIEVAERHADGNARDEELAHVAKAALDASREMYTVLGQVGSLLEWAAACAADRLPFAAARNAKMAATARVLTVRKNPEDWEDRQNTSYVPCSVTQQINSSTMPGERWQVTILAQAVPTGAEPPIQAALLRCIFGNPFRPVPCISSSVLAWNDSTVVKLAQAIYTGKAFEQLPILADALEDAGCTEVELLAHCRGSGPHARGCWPVDLLLGKA